MGYYTNYSLQIECDVAGILLGDHAESEIARYISEQEPNNELQVFLGDDGSGVLELKRGATHSMKWYSHDIDMRRLSRKFPDVLFRLQGQGEEYSDVWRKYYFNGMMQLCSPKISYDPFDPEKLT